MTIKKTIVTACIIGLLTVPTMAKNNQDPMAHHLTEMKQALELSETQLNQIKEILNSSWKQVSQTLEKNHQRPTPKQMEEMERTKQETDKKIQDILTPEQKNKFEAFKLEEKKLRSKHMRDKLSHDLNEKLQLSDSQKKQIESILDRLQIESDKIFSKYSRPCKEEHDELETLGKKSADEIKKILTARQKKEFEALQKEYKNHPPMRI